MSLLNLERSVGREFIVQDIDAPGEFKNCAVTLTVMSKFLDLPGASRACARNRDPTDFSRLNEVIAKKSGGVRY